MKNKKKSKSPYFVLFFGLIAFVVLFFLGSSLQLNSQDKSIDENPLLKPFNTPFNVPPFEKIKTEHFLPAIKEVIQQSKKAIDDIVKNPAKPDFANTLEALDNSHTLLSEVYSIFSVYQSSESSDEIQALAGEIEPLIASYEDEVKLNDKLFQRIKSVYNDRNKLKLTEEQSNLLEKYYKEYAREGANLSPDKKAQLMKINNELAALSVNFGKNLLNETNGFKLIIDKQEDLEGLPESLINMGAQAAEGFGMTGKWVYTLQRPSIFPFLQYSKKRELREKIFKAYISRGDNGNERDNKAIISQIVNLRLEKAKLLGYPNFAELTLDPNMAKNSKTVYEFLDKLWKPCLDVATKEAKELQAMIDKEGGNFKLEPWDWFYYAEKLRKEKYDLDDEVIRPYFKLENVVEGAFYLANKLFGLKFVLKTGVPVYNPDVQVYEVLEADGTHVGIMYIDFFARASKRGGAWMGELRSQSRKDGKRIPPVVTNNHNFAKPTPGKPTLLNIDEVKTLFHEFGHGLHGLLSNTTYFKTGGTNVALDFVELPSQVMENWVMEPEILKVLGKHYQTGEVIPKELLDKIVNSQLFNLGFDKVEFLAATYLDMDWHIVTAPAKWNVDQFENDAMKKINLIHEIVPRYRSTYFNHIFNSQYSAGYYSYVWAEVLDADAFAAFKDTGNIFNPEVAKAFRTYILEKGSSAPPMELYKRFRGAQPDIKALLKRYGFIK